MAKGTRIVKWRLADLKPHPQQQAIFGDAADHEIAELAADIEARGLEYLIQAMPDGTILRGHRRRLALMKLGYTEYEVLIRDDLASDPESAEYAFIADNLVRRQMSKLALARCYRRLRQLQLALYRRPAGECDVPRIDLRDQLGKRLGLSGRSLDRLERILDTPVEIQYAFECGELPLLDAGAVAGLPREVQAKIAAAIRCGKESAKSIVIRFLTTKAPMQSPVADSDRRFLATLKLGCAEIAGQLKDIDPAMLSAANARTLQAALKLLNRLIALDKETRKRKSSN